MYAFDNSASAGECENIIIEKASINKSNSVISPLVNFNVDDQNNVFVKCKNLKLSGVSIMNTFVCSTSPTASNNTVGVNSSTIKDAMFSIVINTSKTSVSSSKRVRIEGSLVNGSEDYTVTNCDISGCSNINISGAVSLSKFFGNTDCGFTNVVDSEIKDNSLVYANGLQNCNISLSNRISIKSAVNTNVINCAYTSIISTYAILFYNMTKGNIFNLKNSFKPQDKEGDVYNIINNPTLKILHVDMPTAGSLVDGDMVLIRSLSSITFDKPLKIGFDINSDTVVDTPLKDIVMANQQVVYIQPPVNNFVLFFESNKFELIPLPGVNVIKISGDTLYFDGLNSNLQENVNYDSVNSSIALETIDYNVSHAGAIIIDTLLDGDISKVTTIANAYPNLKRKLQKGVNVYTLTLSQDISKPTHGILLNSSPLTFDDQYDYLEIERSGNLWRETASGQFS